jgi:hypothetical protein
MSQAQAISYVEVYWLLAIVSVLMFFLSFLLGQERTHEESTVPLEPQSSAVHLSMIPPASLLSRHQDLWCSCT